MNNYIIDPQVVYWINVLNILQTTFAIFGAMLIVAFIILVIGWINNALEAELGYEQNLRYMKQCRKWAIVTGIIGFALTMMAIFIPGKTTSVEMLVAKTATFDNVDWTVQQIKEVVDYIVHAIRSI